MRLILILITFTIQASLFSQNKAIGTWTSYMPFGSSLGVLNADDKIYGVSPKALFSYTKETGEIQKYDKSIGLSDLDIRMASYDPATKYLVIAYVNGNIDLIYDGVDIYNIPDIKYKATNGAIFINGIAFFDGNAYISSDLGISVINLYKKEISNTYIIGSGGGSVKVYQTAVSNGFIYAATEEGVRYASVNSGNLQDFNSWLLFDQSAGMLSGKATKVCSEGNNVYAVNSKSGQATDSLLKFNGQSWQLAYTSINDTFISLEATAGGVYFTTWNDVNTSGNLGKIDDSGNISVHLCPDHSRPTKWFESGSVSWESDFWTGLYKRTGSYVENIVPEGPFSSKVFKILISDGVVYIAPGGADESWGYTYNRDGFYYYKGGKWFARNEYTDQALRDYTDIMSIASVSSTGKTYFGSYFSGLIEMDNASGSLNFYNKDNSILEGDLRDAPRTKIPSMTVDKQDNLWMINGGAPDPIKVLGTDGIWRGYKPLYTLGSQVIKKIVMDDYGQFWCPIRRAGEGIVVWSNGGTLDDESDDKTKLIVSGAGLGGLPDPTVWTVAKDKDNNIWVGTNQGIGIFYCAGSIFSGNCDADQIKVERDGYVGYLFGTETVRAIAVDAANRKWIGTNNGLWLVSADGKDELLKFNVDNSPLPSNQITDISVNDNTGEVFIGTDGGLVSYQGDALGKCSDCKKALVYPNPVKPEYEGPIAIKGLTENAYVKITDVSGTLVYQGRANGSQMVWSGTGYNGNRVQSGVYIVYSSTDLGKEKEVAKIVVIN